MRNALTLGLIGWLVWTAPVSAEEPSTIFYAFHCGEAQVEVASTCMHKIDHLTQCTNQTAMLTSSTGRVVILPHDGKAAVHKPEGPLPVLDALVTAYMCGRSETNDYVILWYTCRWGKDCGGNTMEWERVFDSQGTHLTAGIKKFDVKEVDKLYKRLGVDPNTFKLHPVEY